MRLGRALWGRKRVGSIGPFDVASSRHHEAWRTRPLVARYFSQNHFRQPQEHKKEKGRWNSAEESPYEGFICLNKPSGMTSHDCLIPIRRLLGMKRIGHTGTLDPFATGVLVVAIGRATRAIRFLENGKRYRGTVTFGKSSDSDDIDGSITYFEPAPWLTREHIEEHLPRFIGTFEQKPPVVSAVKVQGKRLYKLAKHGKVTEEDVPARTVTVDSIKIEEFVPGEYPTVSLDIECGGGMYIRSLARDIGNCILGPDGRPARGLLSALHRTKSGYFTDDKALDFSLTRSTPEEFARHVVPTEEVLGHLPWVTLNGYTIRELREGRAITNFEPIKNLGGFVRLYGRDGPGSELIGIGQQLCHTSGWWKIEPEVTFRRNGKPRRDFAPWNNPREVHFEEWEQRTRF